MAETAAQKAKREAQARREAKAKADSTESVEVSGAEAEAGQGEGNTAPAADTSKRAMPVYELGEALDELPTSPTGRRDQMYVRLLTPIVENENLHNKWVPVATFKSPTGAREAEKAVEKGERTLPAGTWETGAVRIEPELAEGETTQHNRWSRLFFKFVTETDD